MLQINKVIVPKLKEIPQIANQKQYYDIAIDKSQFPLSIINIPNVYDNQNRNDIYIEIDIWNGSTADKVIELNIIADEIDKRLRKYKYLDSEMQVTIDRQDIYRLNLDDTDPQVKRIQLKYVAKTYFFN